MIQHHFSQFKIVESLWTDIKQRIKRKVDYQLHMTQMTKNIWVLIHDIQEKNFKPVSFIFLINTSFGVPRINLFLTFFN